MYEWNLDRLYLGLEDPKYISDLELVDKLIKDYSTLVKNVLDFGRAEFLEKALNLEEDLNIKFSKLIQFVSLSLATDVSNIEFNNAMMLLRQRLVSLTIPKTQFEKVVAQCDDLEEIISKNDFLKEYVFLLRETKKDAKYLLSDNEELMASELNQSGASLFSKMQGDLTSTLIAEYRDQKLPLSQVRNLAYDSDQDVREDAYFAELKAYEKINKATSFALNGIKKEVITMSKKRGYSSPLEQTLKNSLLSQKALDALLVAMKEALPNFHLYLKRKGEILGHKNGLAFYDLFAPMGSLTKKYTVEEAQDFILKHFFSYADDLGAMAKEAFTNDWVDYLPREGKRGGAFCAGLYSIKESRILTNFNGSIGDISTLAHELGHAYHNYHLKDERVLNTSYPMPIAETASILCETIVKKKALDLASSVDEQIGLLEQDLQDSTQVIVDIYSRYLFEAEVFKRSENEFLNETVLDDIMKRAQISAYGDGLDPQYLHPKMWINKSHYYSSGRSYYNFPYAFGLLFAKGVYAKYEENGPSYTKKIAKLLKSTGKATINEVASSINIDIEDPNYWRSALAVIKEDIDLFLKLSK